MKELCGSFWFAVLRLVGSKRFGSCSSRFFAALVHGSAATIDEAGFTRVEGLSLSRCLFLDALCFSLWLTK